MQRQLARGRIGLVGVGVLTFTVLILWIMLAQLRGGSHPLALEPELNLCEVLDTSVWQILPDPWGDAIVRVPAKTPGDLSRCALEQDPVTSSDRWSRVMRGPGSDRVREIASVMVVTRAALWRQSPGLDVGEYALAWSAELGASGWPGRPLDGDWDFAEIFTGDQGQQGVVIEDNGVFIWIKAAELETDLLVRFATAVSDALRNHSPVRSGTGG